MSPLRPLLSKRNSNTKLTMESQLDAELLSPDVLVLGSGLQESYLAWQLSLAGLRILHLDSNPHYGGSQAALTLPELTSFLSSSTKTFRNSSTTPINSSKLGNPRQYNFCLAPHLIYPKQKFYGILEKAERTEVYNWGVVDGFFTFVPSTEEGKTGDSGFTGAVGGVVVKAGRKWNKRKNKSSVGSIGSLSESVSSRPSTATSITNSADDTGLTPKEGWNQGRFRRAPSSEEDIAWASDISDSDRATMGLFLRSTTTSTFNPAPTDDEKSLQAHLTSTYPLPPALISRIASLLLTHTPPSSLPLSTAMRALASHASNLGTVTNVPSAAALVVSYGQLGEICQDWARLVAVHGGVNILGRSVTSLSNTDTNTDSPITATLNTGETITTKYVIGSSAELPQPGVSEKGDILRKAIYIIDRELTPLFAFKGAGGKVARYQLPSAASIYYPDNSVGNRNPILVLVRGAATSDCPKGQTVLYLSTIKDENEGQDASFDRAVDTLLDGCDWGEEKPEVVWKGSWDQSVGTATEWEGRVVKVGELAGDLRVGDEVWEKLDSVVETIKGTCLPAVEKTPEQSPEQSPEQIPVEQDKDVTKVEDSSV